MPTYTYECLECGSVFDRVVKIAERDEMHCQDQGCEGPCVRRVGAPLGRVAGRPVKGGGADRFTADMLGIPLKELPAGLRQDKGLTPGKS